MKAKHYHNPHAEDLKSNPSSFSQNRKFKPQLSIVINNNKTQREFDCPKQNDIHDDFIRCLLNSDEEYQKRRGISAQEQHNQDSFMSNQISMLLKNSDDGNPENQENMPNNGKKDLVITKKSFQQMVQKHHDQRHFLPEISTHKNPPYEFIDLEAQSYDLANIKPCIQSKRGVKKSKKKKSANSVPIQNKIKASKEVQQKVNKQENFAKAIQQVATEYNFKIKDLDEYYQFYQISEKIKEQLLAHATSLQDINQQDLLKATSQRLFQLPYVDRIVELKNMEELKRCSNNLRSKFQRLCHYIGQIFEKNRAERNQFIRSILDEFDFNRSEAAQMFQTPIAKNQAKHNLKLAYKPKSDEQCRRRLRNHKRTNLQQLSQPVSQSSYHPKSLEKQQKNANIKREPEKKNLLERNLSKLENMAMPQEKQESDDSVLGAYEERIKYYERVGARLDKIFMNLLTVIWERLYNQKAETLCMEADKLRKIHQQYGNLMKQDSKTSMQETKLSRKASSSDKMGLNILETQEERRKFYQKIAQTLDKQTKILVDNKLKEFYEEYEEQFCLNGPNLEKIHVEYGKLRKNLLYSP